MEKKHLAKKMMLIGAMASGISLGNSYFNNAQATGTAKTHTCVTTQDSPYHKHISCTGSGSACSTVSNC